jgi:hypothetical protein
VPMAHGPTQGGAPGILWSVGCQPTALIRRLQAYVAAADVIGSESGRRAAPWRRAQAGWTARLERDAAAGGARLPEWSSPGGDRWAIGGASSSHSSRTTDPQPPGGLLQSCTGLSPGSSSPAPARLSSPDASLHLRIEGLIVD